MKLQKIAKRQTEENKLTNYEKKKIPLLERIRAGKKDVSFDEFDRVADFFDDQFADIDYDKE